MDLRKLIEEYQECHDKQRLEYLKTQIDIRTKEYIARCLEYQIKYMDE